MRAPVPQIKPAGLREFHQRLAHWYAAHGRHDLPWRQTRDPYAIWVSEVMLQQTQVSTVLGKYYGPFLKTFPTLAALAKAPREQVLKAWEGLGYYRRAGYLHEAAKTASSKGGLNPLRANALPPAASGSPSATQDLLDSLLALPGIGRNTAQAILAFAHGEAVPILEANVKRVVARIFALETPKEEDLWQAADTLLNRAASFDYNQAMMDLGATICTPKAPRCGECPANTICRGQGSPESYPAPKAKKRVPVREVTLVVLEDKEGRLYLEAREAALLGGLYGFPQAPREADSLKLGRKSIALPRRTIGKLTQIYSHFRLEGEVRHVKLPRAIDSPGWYRRAEIKRLPLSKLDHKVLALLSVGHSGIRKK